MKIDNWVILLVLFLVVFDFFIWAEILFNGPNKNAELYFLDVGQGDAELVVLPGGVKILIDAGPNNRILGQLNSILSPFSRYFDLIILSHPQTDHFTGLIDVLKRYQAGVFISNGQKGTAQSFKDLEKIIQENKIRTITLGEGDKVRYQDSYFEILSPSKNLLSSNELNEAALVMKLNAQGVKTLFTGDISISIENYLLQKYDLDIDVLKVAHHGSKYSSGEKFLSEISPKIAVIEVGKNSYGHPTAEVLKNLASVGAQILRTDKDGMIKLVIDNQRVKIFKKKQAQ
jgi:competence protein ComEC